MNLNVRRIEGRMKELGLTQEQVANKMGISARTIFTILKSGELTKLKYLPALAKALEVSEEWLSDEENPTPVKEGHSPYNAVARGSSSKPNMWVVTAKAQGGFILGFANRMFRSMIDRVPFPLINGECFSFEIEGFSMYPAYEPGARVVCTFIPDTAWLRKGKTYVFQTHDGLVIKNFQKVEDGKIYLASENPVYNPVNPIRTDDLVQLYEIEYVITRPPNKAKPGQ